MEDLFFPLPVGDYTDPLENTYYSPDALVWEEPESTPRHPIINDKTNLVASFEQYPDNAEWVLNSWELMPESDKDDFVAAILEIYVAETNDIQALYMHAFGRVGDPESLAYWALSMINTGEDAIELLKPVISGSADYAGMLKETLGNPAAMEEMDSSGEIESYIRSQDTVSSQAMFGTLLDKLYMDMSGRTADEEGKAYWVSRLQSGSVTLPDIMGELMNSGGRDEVFLYAKTSIAYDAVMELVDHGLITNKDISLQAESGDVIEALDMMEDRLAGYSALELPDLADDRESLIESLLRESDILPD